MKKVIKYCVINKVVLILFLIAHTWSVKGSDTSKIVYKDLSGKLNYVSDNEENRIPDFSFAGYKSGEAPFPDADAVIFLSPIAGDNSAQIQYALDSAGSLPMNAHGIRGAVHLSKGKYEINNQLYIRHSGVILRGEGSGSDPDLNSIIFSPNEQNVGATLIKIKGAAAGDRFQSEVANTRTSVTNEFLPVNSRSFKVEDVTPFKVGDTVVVRRNATDAWLEMVDYGGVNGNEFWEAERFAMLYPRHIVAINGKTLILDQPVYEHIFDSETTPTTIYKLKSNGFVTNAGIENLRVTIGYNTANPEEENRASSCISFDGTWDCWAKNVTTEHFRIAGFNFTSSNRITVDHCKAINPIGIINGGYRYNFSMGYGASNVLVRDAETSKGRHAYVSNGTSWCSGIVFYNCKSSGTYSSIEGHRWWTQALLYDNLIIENANTLGTSPTASSAGRVFGLYNRGNYGTGHGWSASHSVAWNCTTADAQTRMVIQKPPTSQNYAMFCTGTVTGDDIQLQNEPGYFEGNNQEESPAIPSLYLSQLNDRLSYGVLPDPPARIETRYTDNKLIINWLDNSGEEEGYVLLKSNDDGQTYIVIDTIDANQEVYSMDLEEHQIKCGEYHFQMYSISRGRNSTRINFSSNQNPSVYLVEEKLDNSAGSYATAQSSSSPGNIFLLKSPYEFADKAPFEEQIEEHMAAKAFVEIDNHDVIIPTYNLIPGEYRAVAINFNNCISELSSNVLIIEEVTSRIQKVDAEDIMAFFVNSELRLELPQYYENVHMRLFDITGDSLFGTTFSGKDYSANVHLDFGLYILSLKNATGLAQSIKLFHKKTNQ